MGARRLHHGYVNRVRRIDRQPGPSGAAGVDRERRHRVLDAAAAADLAVSDRGSAQGALQEDGRAHRALRVLRALPGGNQLTSHDVTKLSDATKSPDRALRVLRALPGRQCHDIRCVNNGPILLMMILGRKWMKK